MRRLMERGIITADQLKADFNFIATHTATTAENVGRRQPRFPVRRCATLQLSYLCLATRTLQ